MPTTDDKLLVQWARARELLRDPEQPEDVKAKAKRLKDLAEAELGLRRALDRKIAREAPQGSGKSQLPNLPNTPRSWQRLFEAEKAMSDEDWERRRAWIREGLKQWKIDHPEEVEISRLRNENLRLDGELRQSKAREVERLLQRESHRRLAVAIAVYLGGGFLIWSVFGRTCPACAYRGDLTATWLDFLAMFMIYGWSIGGLFAGYAIYDRAIGLLGRLPED